MTKKFDKADQHKRLKDYHSHIDSKLFDDPIFKFTPREKHTRALNDIGIYSTGDFVYQALPLLAKGRVHGISHGTMGSIAESVMRHTGIDRINVEQSRNNKHHDPVLHKHLNETMTRIAKETMKAIAEGEAE